MPRVIPEAGSAIAACDHVIRYIRPRHIHDGVVNGDGFLGRPGEAAPSVNWLEWFDPPIEQQVAGVRSVARITYAKTGQLVRLNVGSTIRYVWENDPGRLLLQFVHDPLDEDGHFPSDPSHALIVGVPVADSPEAALIKDLIADCILRPLYPATPQPS